jgi:membrane protein
MVTQAKDLARNVKALTDERHTLGAFITKLRADNIGLLAGFVSWSILTSMIPIVVGVVALTGLFLQNPSTEQAVVDELSHALQGVLSPQDIETMVKAATSNSGLLALIGFGGLFWGSSNVGGSISTACQAIFEVRSRPFVREKLIDLGMLFVLTVFMLLVVAGSLASAFLNNLLGASLPGVVQFLIGTTVSFAAAFLLFAAIYTVFPNIEATYKWSNVWRGALLAAALFQIVSYIWPFYVRISHFSRYSAFLFSVLVLTAWIYFFAVILIVGAEVVAVSAIREAQRHGESVGPLPQRTVPQHLVLRKGRKHRARRGSQDTSEVSAMHGVEEGSDAGGGATPASVIGVQQAAGDAANGASSQPPILWALFALLVAVATLAAVSYVSRRKERVVTDIRIGA